MKRLVLLLAAIAFIAPNYACSGHTHTDNQSSEQVQAESQQGAHATLNVQGSCGMCKTRIEKAAKSVDGVTFASWDRETQVLHLNFDSEKTSLDTISKAVAKVGHDTEKDKADDNTYNALPGCCKYRK